MRDDHFLRLFGVPVIHDHGGQPVALRTKKQLGLLVYLALEARARPVSRDALVDLLWANAAGERARHSLAQALTAIRNLLGVESLTRGGDRVMLRSGLETDLDRLRAGVTDIDLRWPLSDVEHWAGTEFAHWVEGARTRLRRAAVDTLLESMRRLRSSGASQRVYECAETLYRLDPLSDVAIHALAEAALVKGDIVGAIRMLREHIRQAETEIGCNPYSDLARLLERLEAGAHPPVDTVPARLAAEGRQVRKSVFVGRESELARLEAEWESACAGQLRTCLVVGPGGIGKTSLVRRFATALSARAFPVFFVSCQEIGHGIPFAALADLINALCRDPSLSATDPMWLAEASRVNPALKARYPGIPAPPSAPAESIRIRVAEAIQHMLEAVADGKPLALIFDDVQHIDPATRDVLFVFRRRKANSPILIVGTQRTDDGGSDISINSSTRTFGWDLMLPLAGLQRTQVERLISAQSKALSPSSAVRTQITSMSEGNPYFVEMLLADWQVHEAASLAASCLVEGQPPSDWTPPDSLRVAFARMYEGLSIHAQRLVQVLAAAHKGLAANEITRSSGMKPTLVDDGALDLMRRGILRLDGERLVFKNELHRAYVYFAMSDDARRYYHLQLAKAGSLESKPGFQEQLEKGYHFIKAGLWHDARVAITGAAEEAVARGAPVEAERALSQLVAIGTEEVAPRLLVTLASAQLAQGKYEAALESTSRIDASDASQRDVATIMVLNAECRYRGQLSTPAQVQLEVSEALTAARLADDSLLQMVALQILAEVAAEFGDIEKLKHVNALADEMALNPSTPLDRGLVTMTLGYCKLVDGDSASAVEAFSEAARILRTLRHYPHLSRVLNGLGIALSNEARKVEAVAAFREAITNAGRMAYRAQEATFCANLADLYHDFGDFRRAHQYCQQALELSDASGESRAAVVVNLISATLALDLGDFEAADRLINVAESQSRQSKVPRDRHDVVLVRADYHVACGQLESAWTLVERHLDIERKYVLGYSGRHERLARHYILVTRGYEQYDRFAKARQDRVARLALAAQLELAAFDVWVQRREECAPINLQQQVINRILKTGFVGVLAHLITLRTSPVEIGDRPRNLTSAQLIGLLFPEHGEVSPPQKFGQGQQSI